MTSPKHSLRWSVYIFLSIAVLIGVGVINLLTGEIPLRLSQFGTYLSDSSSMEHNILTYIRIPRTLLAIAVGGGLSLSGAILQGIYRNPLVEPYTLGISGGASLGVTLMIVLGLSASSVLFLPLGGFAGAFVIIFLVYALSLRRGAVNINRMLLIGVMISFISSSLMLFLMSITKKENISNIVFWTMGSLNETNPHLIYGITALSFICLLVAYLFVMPLNALRLGETKARHLGIDTSLVVRLFFILTSLLTGASIAVAGVIGFVGLIIPHIVRLWVGSDYRILLVTSFLSGGSFLILCDIVARTIIRPNELPIGVITGIVGGIVFIVLLSRTSKQSKLLS